VVDERTKIDASGVHSLKSAKNDNRAQSESENIRWQKGVQSYAGPLGRDLLALCTQLIDEMLRLDSGIEDNNKDIHSFAKAYEHTLQHCKPAVNFEQTVVDKHAKF
jgi:hypothetical protein